MTDRGARPVETLKRGDKVVTRDNGLSKIAWVGRRDLSLSELAANPELLPYLVRRDAFGPGRPSRNLLLSPEHRLLMQPRDVFLETGGDECLVAVKHLRGHRRIGQASSLGVSYIHLLCDRHQVILADGMWTESFHPDDQIMRRLGNSQRRELVSLFPDIETMGAAQRFPAARRIIKPSFFRG